MPVYLRKAQSIEEVDEFSSARSHLAELVERLRSSEAQSMTHAELEELVTREGREIERRLLQGHLELRAAREQVQESIPGADGVARTHHRIRSRPLATVFGVVTVLRTAYSTRGREGLCPLDSELNLPEERYSHGLRRHAAIEAARGSFDQAVEAVERSTGTKVPKRQVEELVVRAARDCEAFYAEAADALSAATDKDLLVLSLDGKGVVMRREDLREATQERAAASEHKLGQRLSKGEKRNRKRMATVAAVYDLEPQVRFPSDIIADLRPMRDVSRKRPRARNKRVWASVEKSAIDVTRAVFEEAHRRDPEHRRPWVVLVDGDRHQIARVRAMARCFRVKVTLVVDFIHVLEYLWKAAWCFFAEGDRATDAWVTERAGFILEGRSGAVAAGIRRSATRRNLAAKDRKGVDACCDYLIAKRSMLAYAGYLAQGFPIATGVIEGACRHLICDRMDITGARWGLRGAEAILCLRSLRSSGDLDDYWRFHLDREHQRNHAAHYAQAAA
ncbi:MAG: ISKra4 family transposase [Chloroflexota bacterium]